MNLAERWSRHTGGLVTGVSPVVAGGALVVADSAGLSPEVPEVMLRGLDLETAAVIWQRRMARVIATPAVAGSVLYVPCDDRTLHALDAADGREVWAFTAGARITTPPLPACGRVFLGLGPLGLLALDGAGQPVWSFKADGAVRALEVCDETLLLTATQLQPAKSAVYAVTAATGQRLWMHKATAMIRTTPCVGGGCVVVGCEDGTVRAVSLATGKEQWRFRTGGPVLSTPVCAGSILYVASTDANLYALDVTQGALRWMLSAAGPIEAGLGFRDGALSFATCRQQDVSPRVYLLSPVDAGGAGCRFAPIAQEVRSAPVVNTGVLYVWEGNTGKGTVRALSARPGASPVGRLLAESRLMVDAYDVSGDKVIPSVAAVRTCLAFFTEDGLPQAELPVKIWAAASLSFASGGKPYTVDADRAVWLQTDAFGRLALTNQPWSVTQPTLYVWAPWMEPKASVAVYPDREMLTRLAAVTGDDLAGAIGFDGKPALREAYRAQPNRHPLAASLRHAVGGSAGEMGSGTWRLTITDSSVSFEQARPEGEPPAAAGSYSEFVRNVVLGPELIAQVVWSAERPSVRALIHTEKAVYEFALDTASHGAAIATGIARRVTVRPGSLFEWLSLRLDWAAIVDSHDTLLARAESSMAKLQAWVAAQREDRYAAVRALLDDLRFRMPAVFDKCSEQLGGATLQQMAKAYTNPKRWFGTEVPGAYTAGHWVIDLLNQAGCGPEEGTRAAPDPLAEAFAAYWAAAAKALETPPLAALADLVRHGFAGATRGGFMRESILDQTTASLLAAERNLAGPLIQFADATAPDLFALLDKALVLLPERLGRTVTVPVLSDLYVALTKRPLTPLRLAALMTAVPAQMAPGHPNTFARYFAGLVSALATADSGNGLSRPARETALAAEWLAVALGVGEGGLGRTLAHALRLLGLVASATLGMPVGPLPPPLAGSAWTLPWVRSGFGGLLLGLDLGVGSALGSTGALFISLPYLAGPLSAPRDGSGASFRQAARAASLVEAGLLAP
ncbi:MAG: PQQ-binding-like beta-propeller repeat protein [Thermoanaerobaculia bacterium]